MGIFNSIKDTITNWRRGSPTKGMSEEDFAEWLGIGYRNKSDVLHLHEGTLRNYGKAADQSL